MANARAAHRPAVAPLRFGTALFAMVLLVFALAQAAPSATPLRVVYAGDAGYPPFDFVDERGRATGFDVELFRAVAAHAGLDVDYRLGPWESVIADLHARRVDVVPMLVTEERARRLRFSEPFLRSYHLVFGRRGRDHVADLQALAGHRVAAQIAGVAWEELRRARGVRIVPVDVEGDALRAVQDGRADYAVAPMYIGYEAARQGRAIDQRSLRDPPHLRWVHHHPVTDPLHGRAGRARARRGANRQELGRSAGAAAVKLRGARDKTLERRLSVNPLMDSVEQRVTRLRQLLRESALSAPSRERDLKPGLFEQTITFAKWGAAAGAALFLVVVYSSAHDAFGGTGYVERVIGLLDPTLHALLLRYGLQMALLGACLVGMLPPTMALIEELDTGCMSRIRTWVRAHKI